MPDIQLIIFVMCYMLNWSADRVARATGIPLDAIKYQKRQLATQQVREACKDILEKHRGNAANILKRALTTHNPEIHKLFYGNTEASNT